MKIRRFIYIIIPIVLFSVVLLIDVFRKNMDTEITGLMAIREILVIFAFFSVYLFWRTLSSVMSTSNPIRRAGIIFFITLELVLWFVLATLIPKDGFISQKNYPTPIDYHSIILANFSAINSGVLSIGIFLHLKSMVLLRKKKGTRRNFLIFSSALLITAFSSYEAPPLESGIITVICMVITITFAVINSFKLSWIVYLSKREKIYGIIYGILLMGALIFLNSLYHGVFIQKALLYYSAPMYYFITLVTIFGAIYFGMTFISTVFHMPTADVYERKQSEVTSLHNLGRLVTRVFNFEDLVKTVTRMTLEVCNAQSSWLEIMDLSGKTEIVSMRNITTEQIQELNGEDPNLLHSIAKQEKKVVQLNDLALDKRFGHAGKIRKTIGSLLIVPLFSHDGMLGTLYATKGRDDSFDQDDIDVISTFGDNVMIAIENSRLFEKSIERERLQRDMLLAREMQQKLLPQVLPVDRRYELSAISIPAQEVGGDYYDIVYLENEKIGIAVGDVSGKGVSAAFVMAEVKGIFQSLSKLTESPANFLVQANNALSGNIDKKSFISLVYVILDPVASRLKISRAGHCPMLFFSEGNIKFVQPTGIGLGLTSKTIFEETIKEEEIILKNGDICVFYTDGVTEARNNRNEEFGVERLGEVVREAQRDSAEKIREALIQAVQHHSGNGIHTDDITVVVLRWQVP